MTLLQECKPENFIGEGFEEIQGDTILQAGDQYEWKRRGGYVWQAVRGPSHVFFGRQVQNAKKAWSSTGRFRRKKEAVVSDPPIAGTGSSGLKALGYSDSSAGHFTDEKVFTHGVVMSVGSVLKAGTEYQYLNTLGELKAYTPDRDEVIHPHSSPIYYPKRRPDLIKTPENQAVTPTKPGRSPALGRNRKPRALTKQTIKNAALTGAKGIGGAFLDGAKGAGANESIRFLIAGLRRAGTWHPLLDAPNIAPVVEVVLPALLGITLGSFEGQVPYAGEASQFLLLAAQEPARRLGADAVHHFGTLARAVILQDEKALDGALKAMLPASTAPSFTDFLPTEGEKEKVPCAQPSTSPLASSSSPPLAAVEPVPTP